MCLVALALGCSERFPLVLASNRDEFFARPTAPLSWWPTTAGGPAVLAGRDLQAGGTWLGLSATGRLALVTNVRDGRANAPDAPSRGQLVPQWLASDEPFDAHWPRVATAGHNGYNLIAADAATGQWHWASPLSVVPRRLADGLYGLSNAALDTPWPKVESLKSALRTALALAADADALAERLFAALADPAPADDSALPSTGVPIGFERALSSAWIRTDDGRYGTRCSTLVITERCTEGLLTRVIERGHGPGAVEREALLPGWPAQPVTPEPPTERMRPG